MRLVLGRDMASPKLPAILNLPFAVPTDICAGIKAQRHRLSCCESINVGGLRISREQAREIILNCDDEELIELRACVANSPVPTAASVAQIEQVFRDAVYE